MTQSLVQQLKEKRAALMISELEDVALRLFEERGFAEVTVQEIAAEAQISVRTFYRYFPAKEDILQLRIQRNTEVMAATLENRPPDEPPLHSVRVAFEAASLADDEAYVRRWVSVVRANPPVIRAVMGGIQLNSQRLIAEHLGSKLGLSASDLIPTMLAAAAGGVIQAAHTRWYMEGGNLPTIVSESLEVLERAMGPDLSELGRRLGPGVAASPLR
ncbi:MAG: TetR family transcriptional regulator [Acidimicrobiales bacterium]